jgi:hypothetical protein
MAVVRSERAGGPAVVAATDFYSESEAKVLGRITAYNGAKHPGPLRSTRSAHDRVAAAAAGAVTVTDFKLNGNGTVEVSESMSQSVVRQIMWIIMIMIMYGAVC